MIIQVVYLLLVKNECWRLDFETILLYILLIIQGKKTNSLGRNDKFPIKIMEFLSMIQKQLIHHISYVLIVYNTLNLST